MDTYKTVWWIARPSRDPLDFVPALNDLQRTTNNFTDQWQGNRLVHERLESNLGKSGSKRDHNSQSGSSGRTWTSWLRDFGFIYFDDKHLVLTSVGNALISGQNVYENITKQLLCYQLSNPISLEKKTYSPDVNVHPHRFTLKVCLDSRLNGYLSVQEITLFCLPTLQDSQINQTITNILEFRSGTEEFKQRQINDFESLDYRRRVDSSSRSFYENCLDITNTLLKHIEYTGLINRTSGRSSQPGLHLKKDGGKLQTLINQYDERYPFDYRYLQSEAIFGERYGLDVSRFKSKPVTKNKVASSRSKQKLRVQRLLSKHINLPYQELDIITKELQKAGFSPTEAHKQALSVQDMQQDQVSQLNSEFINSYLNQKNDRDFEKQTNLIFKELGFSTAFHPKEVNEQPSAGKRDVDILLRMKNDVVALIDSKNYHPSFALSSALSAIMGTEYVPGYEGFEEKHVRYFAYITANKFSGEKNIDDIRHKAEQTDSKFKDLSGTIISAKALLALLNYVQLNSINIQQSEEYITSLFNSNTTYATFAKIKNHLQIL